ncbi:L-histidine N(alpha)-methyltransferase [Alteribacillus bidgolensis]|uniref:Dimethylhistidine N-methyltransferase n=1 Tax=Alteribacillus bidgolensis TaxID=930129 RepID=A0A1G8QS16_9BACI|nr:L-histidine N(alpha)-methyltransferase [Alteribacillus bidgolensis]SDJ06960.1 dimethylhistidine N-methyltransferase [Alteribacillus bidgolensis]
MRTINQQHHNITDLSLEPNDFLTDVLQGLSSNPKMLSAKYLYDELGSKLFEKITSLDEYYQTRTEIDILHQSYSTISTLIGEHVDLVELGSGSSKKTHILLDEQRVNSYIPIDISTSMLTNTVDQLKEKYPSLTIHGMVADYTKPFSLPALGGNKKVTFFPGSTIGNFEPSEAAMFLKQLSQTFNKEDGLLIGVDLKKDQHIIEKAYNDEKGITAAFNKNVLTRINRELQCDFKVENFQHHAYYNTSKSRIEMHLISTIDQTVQFQDQTFAFTKNETIHTENSYKYSIDSFQKLCLWCGFKPVEVFMDKNQWFSVHYLEVM